jgi:hypothetical protein
MRGSCTFLSIGGHRQREPAAAEGVRFRDPRIAAQEEDGTRFGLRACFGADLDWTGLRGLLVLGVPLAFGFA